MVKDPHSVENETSSISAAAPLLLKQKAKRRWTMGSLPMFGTIRRILTRPWMDEREYRANESGLRIVFGAVLGFVLAGAERFDQYAFAVLLLATVGSVVSILYISASRRRMIYTAVALGYALTVPWMVARITGIQAPGKLAPTLLIRTLFQVAVEFTPRRRQP